MGFKKTFITEDKIRFKILDLLSRREHSFKELISKLKDRVDSEEKLFEELTRLKEENLQSDERFAESYTCLLYTSPSPRDGLLSRMPSSA